MPTKQTEGRAERHEEAQTQARGEEKRKKTISLFIDEQVLNTIDKVSNTGVYNEIKGRSELIESILREWADEREDVIQRADKEAEAAFAAKMADTAGGYGFAVDVDLIRKILKEQKKTQSDD